MIDHVWTVVCSRAVVDQFSNNVSLQNVIEQVNIRGKPGPVVVPIPLEVMTLWVRADFDVPARGRARITFLTPSGELSADISEFDVDLSGHKRFRSRGTIESLHIKEAGRHAFCIELQNEGESEWREVAAIPLEIVFQPPKRPSK